VRSEKKEEGKTLDGDKGKDVPGKDKNEKIDEVSSDESRDEQLRINAIRDALLIEDKKRFDRLANRF